jgi:hypothetical protein
MSKPHATCIVYGGHRLYSQILCLNGGVSVYLYLQANEVYLKQTVCSVRKKAKGMQNSACLAGEVKSADSQLLGNSLCSHPDLQVPWFCLGQGAPSVS